MSKGPWKKPKGARAPAKPFGSAANDIPQTIGDAPALPPPLPPISGPESTANSATGAFGAAPVSANEEALKAGLGKAFCSATQGVAALLNGFVKSRGYEIDFTPVEPEEGTLWAEFALPVLKMHMPDFEKNPHTVLVVMTVALLSGKFRIKKTIGGTHDATTFNTGTEKAAGAPSA